MLWTLKKALYRTQHKALKVTAKVLPFPVPALLTGPGSVKQLAENLSVRGLRHVLVVTDKVLMEIGLPKTLLASLEKRGISYTIFDDVQPNPTIENVEAGVQAYRQNGCDSIIGFGGGSPIDCAKIIGARLSNPYLSVRRMKGLFRVVLPIPPFFCVPTTAGTGSETTIVGVITDAATHEKFAINDLKLVPKIAVLDPELMVGLPPHITAATGMDALTHAVEAYIGLNGNDFTDENAERATRLVFAHLEDAYRDGTNLEARYNMALASLLWRRSFHESLRRLCPRDRPTTWEGSTACRTGWPTRSILPHVLKFCRAEAEDKLAALATVGGISEPGESNAALSYRFIEHIEKMNERMQIPTTIAELRVEDIPLIVDRALAEAHPDYPVPRIMTRGECDSLVRQLLPS